MVHTSAFKQATGEAIYCDDMPKYSSKSYNIITYHINTRTLLKKSSTYLHFKNR